MDEQRILRHIGEIPVGDEQAGPYEPGAEMLSELKQFLAHLDRVEDLLLKDGAYNFQPPDWCEELTSLRYHLEEVIDLAEMEEPDPEDDELAEDFLLNKEAYG